MFDSRKAWILRPQDQEDDDELLYPIYESDPYLFTIRVHFGGTFYLTPLRQYQGGQVRTIDCISEDYFNLKDMDVIALGAGYKYHTLVMYLWRLPGKSLDNGLRPLQCDEHVVEFLYHASYMRLMDVYLDDQPMISIAKLTNAIPSIVKIVEIVEVEEEADGGQKGGVPEDVQKLSDGPGGDDDI